MEAGKKNLAFGIIMLIISGLCWSSISLLSKIGIEDGLNSITINAARFFVGGGFVFFYLLLFRRVAFKISLRQFILLFVLGVFDYAIGGILFIGSLHFIDASLSFLVLYTYPAIVVIISVLAGREKFRLYKVIAVILTIVGVAFVLEAGTAVDGDEWIGVAMVISAAFVFSIYLVIVEAMMEKVRASTVSFYSLFAGAIGILMLMPFYPITWEAAMRPGNLVILGVVAIIGTAISLVLFLVGVRHVGATKAAVLTTIEPIFVVVIAGMFLNESLSIWQVVGMAIQLYGVFLVNKEPHRQPEPGPG